MITYLSNNLNRIKNIKFSAIFRVFALAILCYLVGLPLYPVLTYDLAPPKDTSIFEAMPADAKKNQSVAPSSAIASFKQKSVGTATPTPKKIGDWIIIEKIGVNAPIIISNNGPAALNKGAWLMPQGSTPEKGSNTVITAHRFKYLPPNNLTFYLIDRLKPGDRINVIWKEKTYNYEVIASRRILPAEVSILNPSTEPMLTIFSCDPVFSTKYRLVVTSKLVNSTKDL